MSAPHPAPSRAFGELLRLTLRDFFRAREALFWTYGFPVLMAVVLGLAFSGGGPERSRVAVIAEQPGGAAVLCAVLEEHPWIECVELAPGTAAQALAAGRVDAVVSGGADRPEVAFDATRVESRLARLAVAVALRPAGDEPPVVAKALPVPGERHRYIDFLIPGLIGLNLLGGGIWGIGYNVVDLRLKKLLRRLVVSPMRRSHFLGALLLGRLGLVVLSAVAVLLFGVVVFGVPVRGSLIALLAVLMVGAAAFCALGLLVGARPRTIEAMSGLMNFVMLPMWLLSGSFFETSEFPRWLQPLIAVLPLTHVNHALRAVVLDGAGLTEVVGPLAYLVGFAGLCFAVALRIFRWV